MHSLLQSSCYSSIHPLTSNWAMDNKQEVRFYLYYHITNTNEYRVQMIDIIETVYRGASKGRGLVVSPKGVSTLASTLGAVTDTSLCRLLHTLQILVL